MSRKSISYARGYEHADFSDLLNELQGEKDSTVIIDGTAAIAIPSPIVKFSVNDNLSES